MTKQANNTKPQTLHFHVDGQLISELGERLITRNHIALSELLKNAYDADASVVSAKFCLKKDTSGKKQPSIVIADDGQGMSLEAIKTNWMCIATANKQKEAVSAAYGRPRTGSKGIGRFACQKLARELHLESTSKHDGKLVTTTVIFEWDLFKAGTSLTKIPCTYSERSIGDARPGTILKLVNLKDNWTKSDYETLHRSLLNLAVAQETERKGYEQDPGIRVEIDSPEYQKESNDLLGRALDSSWGRMTGKVRKDGTAKITLSAKEISGKTTLVLDEFYPEFVGISFDIARFAGGESKQLNRQPQLLSSPVVQAIKDEAGVRAYFQGFRMFPYGEPGDDWLRLAKDYSLRKVNTEFGQFDALLDKYNINQTNVGLLRPHNDNLIGKVYLDVESSNALSVKTNREGFVDNPALHRLIHLLRTSIEWMTTNYAIAKRSHDLRKVEELTERFKQLNTNKEKHSPRSRSETATDAISLLKKAALREEISEDHPPPAQESVKLAAEFISSHQDNLEAEAATLRVLASTGPLLFTFSHEIHSLLANLDANALLLKRVSKLLPSEDRQTLIDASEELKNTSSNFRELSEVFGLMAETSAQEPKRHSVKPLVDSLLKSTSFTSMKSGITVTSDCRSNIRSPKLLKSELVSLLVNLYTNALKSTLAARGVSIHIRISGQNGWHTIEVLDTGVGLKRKLRTEVIKPFVSDPEKKIYSHLQQQVGDNIVSSLGKGTGLGLSIVKGITDKYGGKLEFFEEENWAIGVRIRLPETRK